MDSPLPVTAGRFPEKRQLAAASHGWLDGTEGTNRNRQPGLVQQFKADTDLEAIEAWLKSKRHKSPHTVRAYRREAYRLLAWSVSFRDKPISSLDLDDIEEFHKWLQEPEPHPTWAERGWLIVKGPLSDGSLRQAIVILLGMFNWLVDGHYLSGNPVKMFDGGAAAKQQKEELDSPQERYLPHDLWQWVESSIEALRPETNRGGAQKAYERKRFVLHFLYLTGMRRSELATATWGRLRKDGKDWVLKVKGKGRKKLEDVLLLPSAMAALHRYRISLGLTAMPTLAEEHRPIVQGNSGEAISDNYLNRLMKDILHQLATTLPVEHEWIATLEKASAHWMRHSLATHNAEAGVSMQATADQLRHKSMDTTRRIYTHVAAKHRRKELEKLEEYNHLDRPLGMPGKNGCQD